MKHTGQGSPQGSSACRGGIDVAVVVQGKQEYLVLDQPIQITATAPPHKTHPLGSQFSHLIDEVTNS